MAEPNVDHPNPCKSPTQSVGQEACSPEASLPAASGALSPFAPSAEVRSPPAKGKRCAELFFREGNKLMAVAFRPGGTFDAIPPKVLFAARFLREPEAEPRTSTYPWMDEDSSWCARRTRRSRRSFTSCSTGRRRCERRTVNDLGRVASGWPAPTGLQMLGDGLPRRRGWRVHCARSSSPKLTPILRRA